MVNWMSDELRCLGTQTLDRIGCGMTVTQARSHDETASVQSIFDEIQVVFRPRARNGPKSYPR